MYDIIVNTFINSFVGFTASKEIENYITSPLMITNNKNNYNQFKNIRNKFITDLIDKVTKNIVNIDNISYLFNNDSIKKEFNFISNKLLNECMFKDKEKIRDLEDFHDLYFYVLDLFLNIIENNMSKLLDYPYDKIQAHEFFSKKQVNCIAEKLYNNLIIVFENTSYIEDIIKEFFDKIKDIKISDVISDDVLEKSYKNITNQEKNVVDFFKENMLCTIDNICINISEKIGINKIVYEEKNQILKRPLKEFLNISDVEIKKLIKSNINEFFGTNKSYEFCDNLYSSIISYFKYNSFSFKKLINQKYKQTIENYLNGKVNHVGYTCTGWFYDNISKINDCIDIVVNENEENEVLRKKYKNAIISYINGLRYGSKSISKLFINLAESRNQNLDNISKFILMEIDQYVDNISTSNIIELLQDENIINSEKLYNFIKESLSDDDFISNIVNYITNMSLESVYSNDVFNYIAKNFKYLYIDFLENNIFLNDNYNKNIINTLIYEYKNINNKTFGQTFFYDNIDKTAEKLKGIVLNYIKTNKLNIQSNINEFIDNKISDKSLKDILINFDGIKGAINKNIVNSIKLNLNRQNVKNIDYVGNIKFSDISYRLNKLPEIEERTASFIQNISEELIVLVLNSYLEESIKKYYNNINDTDFINFINNTNPISIKAKKTSGILTGSLMGIGSSILCGSVYNTSLITSVASWQGVFTCALTGLTSNIISQALIPKIQFKNSYLSKIPVLKNLTENYIYSQKKNMADYIIRVMEKSLYNSEEIKIIVKDKFKDLKENLYNILIDNDYEQINYYYLNYASNFANEIYDAVIKFLSSSQKHNIKNFSTSFLSVPLKYVFDRDFNDKISCKATDSKELRESIFKTVETYLGSSKSIFEIIPDNTVYSMRAILKEYLNINNEKTFECLNNINDFKKTIYSYNDSYSNLLQNKLADVVSDENIEKTKQAIYKYTYNQCVSIKNLQNSILNINSKVNKKIFETTKLSDILSKKSKLIVAGLLHKYFGDIIHDFERKVKENGFAEIKNQIKSKLFNSLSFREKKKYESQNGDNTLNNILSDILNLEMSNFIDDNIDQFYAISKDIINEICNINLADLDILADESILIDEFSNLISDNKINILLTNQFYYLFDKITETTKNKTIYDFVKYIGLGNIKSITENYEQLIIKVNKSIYKNIIGNMDYISSEFDEIVDLYIDSLHDMLTYKTVFKNISKENIIKLKSNITDIVNKNDMIYYSVNSLCNSIYNYFDTNDSIYDICDKEEIYKSIETLYNKTVSDTNFRTHLKNIIVYYMKNDLFNQLIESIPESTLNKFISFIAKKINNDIEDNLPSLFSSVDMNDLIIKGIDDVSIDEYKEMFKVFNEVTKNSLINSGAYGALTGINKYIGMFLSFANIIKL